MRLRDRTIAWSARYASSLIQNGLVQNAISLYGVQISGYILTLVTIPYIARILGTAGWGLVAFTQAFGAWVVLVGEFGFSLSATREVARHRDNREKLTEILAGVLGAKALLTGVSIVLCICVRWYVPIFRDHPELFWAGMYWALAQAFSMTWFFQGFERMRFVAILDIAAKFFVTIGIFVFVRHPHDGYRVLLLQGSGFLSSALCCLLFAYRDLPTRLPSRESVFEAIRMGWSMFLFRSSASLYTTGNAFILGFFVSPQLVGCYAGAEKISKAFVTLFNPIGQTLFPRLSTLAHSGRDRAARLARATTLVLGVAGVAIGVFIFTCAPYIVRIILGKGFEPAVPVLRIMSFLVPLIALSGVLGIQWMLPLGLDRAFNAIILIAGLINLVLAVVLAPIYAARGMAWAVVIAEAFVTGGMYLHLRGQRLDPLSYRANVGQEIA